MPNLICTLHLPEPGHRNPTIQLTDTNGKTIASIPTTEPEPNLPIADASVGTIRALDILEHVHDEQIWLAELSRILMPNGELIVRVPLENSLAWLDALNIYRYVADVTGRGPQPRETLPTGWHRHYAPGDLPAILELAGFRVTTARSEGLPLGEPFHLAGLLMSGVILQRPHSERRLFDLRARINRRSRLPMPTSVAARLLMHATLTRSGYRPDPGLDESDRPEKESATPLE